MQNNANEMAVFNTAIYVRLSKEDIVAAQSGRESNSITNQKQLILDFLKDKPEFNIVSIRIDDGYTGTNFDRPAFQRMLNDIKAGRINCVVVKDLSRFGREYINSGKYIHRLFPVLGVRLIAINDNIDTITRDESSEFSITLKNLMNDNYSRDISVKVRSGNMVTLFVRLHRMGTRSARETTIELSPIHMLSQLFRIFSTGKFKA